MKIILPSILASVLFAIPASARSIDCVRGSIKFLDKPNSITISCEAPKRALRSRKIKSASLPAAGVNTTPR